MSFKIDILNTNSYKEYEEYLAIIGSGYPKPYEGFDGQVYIDGGTYKKYYKIGGYWVELVNELPTDGSQSPLVLYNGVVWIWNGVAFDISDIPSVEGESILVNDVDDVIVDEQNIFLVG